MTDKRKTCIETLGKKRKDFVDVTVEFSCLPNCVCFFHFVFLLDW